MTFFEQVVDVTAVVIVDSFGALPELDRHFGFLELRPYIVGTVAAVIDVRHDPWINTSRNVTLSYPAMMKKNEIAVHQRERATRIETPLT